MAIERRIPDRGPGQAVRTPCMGEVSRTITAGSSGAPSWRSSRVPGAARRAMAATAATGLPYRQVNGSAIAATGEAVIAAAMPSLGFDAVLVAAVGVAARLQQGAQGLGRADPDSGVHRRAAAIALIRNVEIRLIRARCQPEAPLHHDQGGRRSGRSITRAGSRPEARSCLLSGGLRRGTAHWRPRRHRTRRPRSGPPADRTGSARSRRCATARRGRPAGCGAPSPPR